MAWHPKGELTVKKIASIAAVLLLAAVLTGCNYSLIDTKYDFDYAVVRWPDGTVETLEIRSWNDYEGEQIQITDVIGNTYIVNSVNCVLVDEYMEEYQEQDKKHE